MYCRVLLRLDWVNRLKLEFYRRPYAYFITLTYDDLHLPVFSGLANLWKPDLDSFIDRIRNYLPKCTVFAVGEYGGHLFENPKAERPIHPHYHIALFSDDMAVNGVIREVCEARWKFGHAHVLLLSGGLIDYITGYASKKLTNTSSMKKIMNLDINPEFIWTSRRPAIGDVTDQLLEIQEEHGEITHLTIDGKKVVIPKYLRFKLKNKTLQGALDLMDWEDRFELERRKAVSKEETLQKLSEKNAEQLTEIEKRQMAGDVYKKRSQIKKQITANFESKIKLKMFSNRKVL